MKIRLIEGKDIENCAHLFSQVFSGEPWNEPWKQQDAFLRLDHFHKSAGFVGVLIESDHVLGFALGNREPFYYGNVFYLREMCIDTSFHSQGIGSKVYAALEKELLLNEVKEIYLATERNIPATSFYEKQGFNYSDTTGFYDKRLSS